MSHYAYGSVNVDCDVETMVKVLENVSPQWKGKIQYSEEGNLRLTSNYQRDTDMYHIRVSKGTDGIIYEDFGMKKENGKWKIAIGTGSKIGKKNATRFSDEIAGELGRYRAQESVKKMHGFAFEESEEEDDYVIKFNIDADNILFN